MTKYITYNKCQSYMVLDMSPGPGIVYFLNCFSSSIFKCSCKKVIELDLTLAWIFCL